MKNPILEFSRFGDSLQGEDRFFGGNQFYVDPVPVNSWFKNLRSMTSLSQWKALSTYVKSRAENRCEICTSDLMLEAHERWLFDSSTKTQKLVRIVCLCKLCHLGTHWGLTGQLGLSDMVERHILSVTGWSRKELSDHLKALPKQPSTDASWKLDVTMVESVFLKLKGPAPVVERKLRELDKSVKKTSIEMEKGIFTPLVFEIRAGYVAFVYETSDQVLGSLPLSMCQPYAAKLPSEISDDVIRIPLSTFVKAHNNPVVVKNKKALTVTLKDRSVPRRLIVDFTSVEEKVVMQCFKDGILFSID